MWQFLLAISHDRALCDFQDIIERWRRACFGIHSCNSPTAELPMVLTVVLHYLQIEAEKLILAANGQQGLRTIALRPSGIFGEGDPLFVPSVINNARKGKMKFIIGSGRNLMDFTYVGNVAYSHILVRLARPSCCVFQTADTTSIPQVWLMLPLIR